jgi:hypothetical protein
LNSLSAGNVTQEYYFVIFITYEKQRGELSNVENVNIYLSIKGKTVCPR